MTNFDWGSQTLLEPELVELVGWNPKLHPRGWGGMFGDASKASSPGVKYVDHGIKPATKVYSKNDIRAIEGSKRAQRVAGHGEILARVQHIKPTRETRKIIKAQRNGKVLKGTKQLPVHRVQPATRLPSRPERARLKVGAKVAGIQRRHAEKQAAKPPKFRKGEFVSIAGGPADRTIVDKVRRRGPKARVGQVHSKRPDGKYVIRTVDGNRDVYEAHEPNSLTVIKPADGDAAPLRPSKELNLGQKVQRARRIYSAYKAGD